MYEVAAADPLTVPAGVRIAGLPLASFVPEGSRPRAETQGASWIPTAWDRRYVDTDPWTWPLPRSLDGQLAGAGAGFAAPVLGAGVATAGCRSISGAEIVDYVPEAGARIGTASTADGADGGESFGPDPLGPSPTLGATLGAPTGGGLGLVSADPTGGDGESTSDTDDEAEAAANNAFVQGLGEAVDEGNAWGYANDYLGAGWYAAYQEQLADDFETPCEPICMADPSEWGPCPTREDPAVLIAACGPIPCGSCPDLSPATVAASLSSLVLRVLPDGIPFQWDPTAPGGLPGWLFDLANDLVAPVETALLEKAWSVLVNNLDAVQWAACYVEGLQLYTDLVVQVFAKPESVELVLVPSGYFCEPNAVACTFQDPTNPLAVFRPEGVVQAALEELAPGLADVLEVFTDFLGNPIPTGVTDNRAVIHFTRGDDWDKCVEAYLKEETCGAIVVAALILHELWHVVRDWHWRDSVQEEPCDDPYQFTMLFLFAMFRRCTEAARREHCCDGIAADLVPFAEDKQYVPSNLFC